LDVVDKDAFDAIHRVPETPDQMDSCLQRYLLIALTYDYPVVGIYG